MARNLGIQAAKGEIAAFIDDDAVAEPVWLRELVGGFTDPRVGCVGGLTLMKGSGKVWSLYSVVSPIGWVRNRTSLRREVRGSIIAFSGVNLAMRRTALEGVGGFDPYFTFYLEETDACLRLVRAGWNLGIRPDAVVHHGLLSGQHRKHVRYQVSRSRAYFVVKNFRGRVPAPINFMTTLLGLALDVGAAVYNEIRGPGRMGGGGPGGFPRGIRDCVVGWAQGIRAGARVLE